MSNEAERAVSAAQGIEEQAGRWLESQELGPWSSQDQQNLNAWLEESTAHTIAYLRVSAAWQRADRLQALLSTSSARSSSKQVPDTSKNPWKVRLGVAVLVCALGAIAVALYPGPTEYQVFATTVGGRETLKLNDGSKIELNTDTVLRLAKGTEQREVVLEKGEAYFEVHHNASHPFVVHLTGHRVVDLGTKFVIREDGRKIQVSLVEGRARLETTDSGKPDRAVILIPGDVAVASRGSLFISHRERVAVARALSWRQGLLVLSRTSLGDAAREMNRYNHEKIFIEDSQASQLTVTGTLAVSDLGEFARIARKYFGLAVERRGADIFIRQPRGSHAVPSNHS